MCRSQHRTESFLGASGVFHLCGCPSTTLFLKAAEEINTYSFRSKNVRTMDSTSVSYAWRCSFVSVHQYSSNSSFVPSEFTCFIQRRAQRFLQYVMRCKARENKATYRPLFADGTRIRPFVLRFFDSCSLSDCAIFAEGITAGSSGSSGISILASERDATELINQK